MNILLPGKKKVVRSWRKNPEAIKKYQFAYHFLPHPTEKRRASLLSNKAIVIYCAALLLLFALFSFLPKALPGVLGYASNITTKDLLYYTNQTRAQNNEPPLRLNKKLTAAAQKKALNMFAKNYWAHVAPDGTEPWSFILGEGYDYVYAGENLAKNFSTSKEVVDAWYNSPSHRENLLSPNYDEMGFAVVNGVLDGYETTLVVQMFGRPRDTSQIASVAEEADVLKQAENQVVQAPLPANTTIKPATPASKTSEVLPSVDVLSASRAVTLALGGFVITLLALDIWFTKKNSIAKFNGHTVAHLCILLVVIVSIWLFLKPGIIL